MKQVTAIFHILIFIHLKKRKKYQPHLTRGEIENIEDCIS